MSTTTDGAGSTPAPGTLYGLVVAEVDRWVNLTANTDVGPAIDALRIAVEAHDPDLADCAGCYIGHGRCEDLIAIAEKLQIEVPRD